jgi:hypothetical protein
MKEIQILRSHYDDWLHHPGWWATADDRGIEEGEAFKFTFPPGVREEYYATCTKVKTPGQMYLDPQFIDWYLYQYSAGIPTKMPDQVTDVCDGLGFSYLRGHYIYIGVEKLYPAQAAKLLPMLETFVASCGGVGTKDFKAYVHQRLDEMGIPTHPDGPHSKEGCRIGDRLDIVQAKLKRGKQ